MKNMEQDVNPKPTTSNPDMCTQTECVIKTSDGKCHQCKVCNRKVHNRCSLLPDYQLKRSLIYGKHYCTYVCRNCIDVPEYLKNDSMNLKKRPTRYYEKNV